MPVTVLPGCLPDDRHFILDTTLHALTGTQMLYHILRYWRVNPQEEVFLWARPRDAKHKVASLRVALAKERKARRALRTFRIEGHEAWPYTANGVRGEVIKLTRSTGGPTARSAALVNRLDLKEIYKGISFE